MRMKDQDLLAGSALVVFKLNGQFLALAEELARPVGLTAAWWQVLGAVLPEPLPVAGIAREMGITRQSVQRIADLLVDRGLAEYRPNPAHRRAKLLACTEAGHWAIRQIALVQRPWADRIGAQLGAERLQQLVTAMRELISVLEADTPRSGPW
jgi:DNA-binding MarR family transcriptional regulator